MPEQTPTVGMERKLAAIFSTDVAGYSRLMGDDEEATIRTLTAYRKLISSLIQHYRGRVVDAPGDNLLAEFASVVDAVRCAVEIQHALKEKNAELPEHRQMHFRIGINLGDVIVEGERLYGDGVNIAARLESLAEPGGICISGTVYDQVENKLALTYDYQGEQRVKNIAKPVRVYRVGLDVPSPLGGEGQGEGTVRESENQKAKIEELKSYRLRPAHRWIVTGLVLLAIIVIAVRYWSSPLPSTQHPAPDTQSPIPNPQSLPLPDKPSLIVLPFVNMSKDPDQEYFSDGLTEVLTGDLSKISNLFIIARNTAFTYKGKALNDSHYWSHLTLGYIYLWQKQYEQALAEMERGVTLGPNETFSYAGLAVVLNCVGRTEDALEAAAKALRLNSADLADAHLLAVGSVYAAAGRLDEALTFLQRYLSRYPNMLDVHLTLAAVYSGLGREAEAHAEAAEVLRLNPKFSLEVHQQRAPIKDPAVLERGITALRKAGLK